MDDLVDALISELCGPSAASAPPSCFRDLIARLQHELNDDHHGTDGDSAPRTAENHTADASRSIMCAPQPSIPVVSIRKTTTAASPPTSPDTPEQLPADSQEADEGEAPSPAALVARVLASRTTGGGPACDGGGEGGRGGRTFADMLREWAMDALKRMDVRHKDMARLCHKDYPSPPPIPGCHGLSLSPGATGSYYEPSPSAHPSLVRIAHRFSRRMLKELRLLSHEQKQAILKVREGDEDIRQAATGRPQSPSSDSLSTQGSSSNNDGGCSMRHAGGGYVEEVETRPLVDLAELYQQVMDLCTATASGQEGDDGQGRHPNIPGHPPLPPPLAHGTLRCPPSPPSPSATKPKTAKAVCGHHGGLTAAMALEQRGLEYYREIYADLLRTSPQLGGVNTPRSEQEHLQQGIQLIQKGDRASLRAYARQGVPPSLRFAVWRTILVSSDQGEDARRYLQQFAVDLSSREWILDDVHRLDVGESTGDSHYFPFEQLIEHLLLALTRDPAIPPMSQFLPYPPVMATSPANDAKGTVLVPPSGVLPFKGDSNRIREKSRPVHASSFACGRPAGRDDVMNIHLTEVYPLFRAVYSTYFIRLHTLCPCRPQHQQRQHQHHPASPFHTISPPASLFSHAASLFRDNRGTRQPDSSSSGDGVSWAAVCHLVGGEGETRMASGHMEVDSTLVGLCGLFEGLAATTIPGVYHRLCALEYCPLKLVFPWIVQGFIGVLPPTEVSDEVSQK
ncbi:unnamed protein product [Vitrella brassicaformis CCMP3155]|uniref:Rab-GAP TBC domain-containing protein n=1 Tax=Vitrella brassicaformis (strain CCMP3155) TaxID=1169540 RepID=A0A0G4EML0_VITBC|nr:unnamed protein product [Vitrella brassicaformis CCMP3155]|eukprot:CEL98247.1 unnamed protein product [Vitrella brassicaformis CCMP3155]